eukprot:3274352-Prymnesium_polylepis.1
MLQPPHSCTALVARTRRTPNAMSPLPLRSRDRLRASRPFSPAPSPVCTVTGDRARQPPRRLSG